MKDADNSDDCVGDVESVGDSVRDGEPLDSVSDCESEGSEVIVSVVDGVGVGGGVMVEVADTEVVAECVADDVVLNVDVGVGVGGGVMVAVVVDDTSALSDLDEVNDREAVGDPE